MRPPRILVLLAAAVLAASGVAAGSPTRPAGISAASSAEDTAMAAVEQRPAATGGADPSELTDAESSEGSGGTEIVRLDQQVDGVPVLGGEVVVAMDAARRVLRVDGATSDAGDARTTGIVPARRARTAAVAAVRKGAGPGLVASDARLVLHDPQVMDGAGPPRARTAWEVVVTRAPAVRVRVYVDAATGIPYQAINLIRTAKSISVCDAASTSDRWPCATPYTRSNTSTPSGNSEVDAAYDLTSATYDFYAGLGRDSLDGNGMRIVSTVNWCDGACPYLNAFWDGSQMVFGPGLASADDVVAHELTHGVTERTSNLVYWYQSGAINEALSDIMGELFDLLRGPAPLGEWKIAEDSPLGIIRDMANPPSRGDPDRIGSPYYLTGIADNGGVHTNSGVANKAAYLIADGGSFNGRTVAPIGRSKSARLWYQTGLTLRMSSDYSDLADALEQTCDGFSAIGYQGFTTTDCAQVRSAVLATEMRTDPLTVPAVCPSGGTSVAAFEDDFSSGIAPRWSTSAAAGANQWYRSSAASPDGLPMNWPTATSSNARAVGTLTNSDSSMAMTNAVTVPSRGYLRFTHWHQFESSISIVNANLYGYQGYDAGVVEYSAGGGPWTDIAALPAVNGYTGTINADAYSDNPLEGRPGFIAASNGAVTTQVDLSSLAGQDVRFRFRQATDTGTGGYGWYIDQVDVHGCITVPDPPTVTAVTPGNGQLSVAFTLGGSGGASPTNVRYSTDDGATWTTRSPASTSSPLVIGGLENGTTYRVRLQAVSSAGTSAQSNMVSRAPTGPVVRTIAITSAVAGSYSFGGAAPTIEAAPSVPGGDVTYASSTTGVCTVHASTGAVTFVAAGTCAISASVDESSNLLPAVSSPVTFEVTPSTPAAPTITGIDPGDGQLSVAFVLAGTGGAPATNVQHSTDGGQSWTPRSPASAASPLVISGLANGQSVDVRLRVVAPGGTSAQSNQLSASPTGPVARTISVTSSVASSYAFDATPPTIVATPSVAGGAVAYSSGTPGVCTVDAATGVVAFATAGPCSITASVAASGNLLAATSAATAFTITPVAPQPPTVNSVTSGQGELAVAFTPGASGGTSLSNIEYSLDDGGTWTPRAPASTASPLVVTGLPNGSTHQVRLRAVGPGGTSTQSNAVAQSTTGPTARTLGIAPPPSPSYAFTATPPSVQATPSAGGGQVSYWSSTPGVCTIDPSTGSVAFVAAGTCSVSATVGASGIYMEATSAAVEFTVTAVAPAAPAITGISAGDGQLSVAFTEGASGGAPATNVRYSTDGGATWTSRSPASTSSPLVITGLDNGRAYAVRLALVGPAGTGAESPAVSQAPNGPVPRTIAISSARADSYAFDAPPPVIAATPSVSGGTVSYTSSTPGTCTVDAITGAVAFVAAGSCSVTAAVAASGNLLPATSPPATFSITAVAPAAPTITWVTAGNGQLSVAFAIGRTGGAPATNVRYSLDGGDHWLDRSPPSIASPLILGGLTNGEQYGVRLQVVAPGGTSGQSDLVSRAPNGPVARTLALAALPRAAYRMDEVAPVISASPSHPGGAITYSSSTPGTCVVDSTTGVVRFVAPGTCQVAAVIAASSNLSAAVAPPASFTILPAEAIAAPAPPAVPDAPSAPEAPPAAARTPQQPGVMAVPGVPAVLPTAIRWSGTGTTGPTARRTLTTAIPVPTGTTISVRATRAGRRAVRGTCRVVGSTARCTLTMQAAGRWTVVVTPITNGVPGRPTTSVMRVR